MTTATAKVWPRPLSIAVWAAVVALGTLAIASIALNRGESINAMWFILAAVCVYAIGYRFYSAFLAAKVFALDPTRATPASRNGIATVRSRSTASTQPWVSSARVCPGSSCAAA